MNLGVLKELCEVQITIPLDNYLMKCSLFIFSHLLLEISHTSPKDFDWKN